MTAHATTMTNPQKGFRITGKMVLFFLLAFFGVVMIANGIFLYVALKTFPGLGDAQAYRSGLQYNETLAAAERQKALGWRTAVAYDPAGRFEVRLFDRHDQPLQYARVDAEIQRPAVDLYDRAVELPEIKPGVYGAAVELPFAGLWRIKLSITGRGGEAYRAIHEIVVAE